MCSAVKIEVEVTARVGGFGIAVRGIVRALCAPEIGAVEEVSGNAICNGNGTAIDNVKGEIVELNVILREDFFLRFKQITWSRFVSFDENISNIFTTPQKNQNFGNVRYAKKALFFAVPFTLNDEFIALLEVE